MRRDLGVFFCGILIALGSFFLVTGIGGGRYSFTTGEWSVSPSSTANGTRVVGALMIGFALLLWSSWRKP